MAELLTFDRNVLATASQSVPWVSKLKERKSLSHEIRSIMMQN